MCAVSLIVPHWINRYINTAREVCYRTGWPAAAAICTIVHTDCCSKMTYVMLLLKLQLNTQSVPRSKHTPSLLYKPVS